MNGLHFSFGVGAFLSPMIITQVIGVTHEIKWGFWIIAMIVLLPAVWLISLPSPAIVESTRRDHQDRFDYPLVILISLIFLMAVGAESSFGGWIYTYTITVHPDLDTIAGYLTAAFWGSLTIGRLLAIPISMHLSPRTILLWNFVGCLASLLLILIRSNLIVAIWIGTIGLGLSIAPIFATLLSFAQRRMKISGRTNGWFFTGAGIGGMTLPWIIGQVFVKVGAHSILITIMLDLMIALGVFLCLKYLYKPRSE